MGRYPSLTEIIQSCPAFQQRFAQDTDIYTEVDQFEPNLGKARCNISTDSKLKAGITFGCRNITQVSFNGCPLRDAMPVKVELPPSRNHQNSQGDGHSHPQIH